MIQLKKTLLIFKGILFLSLILFTVQKVSASIITDSSHIQKRLVLDLDSFNLQTGDLIFFQSKGFESTMIQWGTLSNISHVAFVIKGEDGTIQLTHATNNDYAGYRVPVLGEELARNGVIYTRLDDFFISEDGGKTGSYKHIWICKMDETLMERPQVDQVMGIYTTYKHLPFETSYLRFILTAMDLSIMGKDILRINPDQKIMCSEYVCMIFNELGFPVSFEQEPHETSPKDIYDETGFMYNLVGTYEYQNGQYVLVKE